jgi:hypothetical protein
MSVYLDEGRVNPQERRRGGVEIGAVVRDSQGGTHG